VTQALGEGGPVVAVSDWVRALPDLIRSWVPAPFVSLGTDGFGLSDTRPAVRRHFNVDAESITVAALRALAERGEVDRSAATDAAEKYRIDDPQAAGPQTSDSGVA
jgi:pyruvate dehydrogenase E1 component